MQTIAISKLKSNPFQERKTFEGVERLSKSIKKRGFWGVLLAREKNGVYELAFGERRLRAAKLAGLKELPVEIQKLSDEDMAELCVSENALQETVEPTERAAHLAMMQKRWNLSDRDLAERTGLAHQTVNSLLSLAGQARPVLKAVQDGKIGWTAAVEASKVGGARFVETARENRMTLDEIRDVKKAITVHGADKGIKEKLLTGKITPASLEIQTLRKEYITPDELFSKISKEMSRQFDIMKLLRDKWREGVFTSFQQKMILSQFKLNMNEMQRFAEEVKK